MDAIVVVRRSSCRNMCCKNGRACAGNERGYTAAWVWVVGKRARVPGCNYMHYILENGSTNGREL